MTALANGQFVGLVNTTNVEAHDAGPCLRALRFLLDCQKRAGQRGQCLAMSLSLMVLRAKCDCASDYC